MIGSDWMSDISVTRHALEFQRGDASAAQQLWVFLQQRLVRLAQQEVDRRSTRSFDAEDVAITSFDSLCTAIQEGRYDIASRDELWRLLAVVTVNKVRRMARDENRLCRGGAFRRKSDEVLGTLATPQPDPEAALVMQEECQALLAMLPTKELRLLALLKVEGFTNEEVAEQLGCTRRAIQRRLVLIREAWAAEVL
ncbi:RNA polymerase sigma factor SigD [Planctomycetes bacterium K23_9]|uniref:RNA polymerase sigma factor SigD n=2 Tax=Stieleria marina TaxID=1930275 RepID=A0A517P0J0_9BACT|nr:RNA polymerase sigma factor SigD [Planctomycetes bacterium K23_9]